jgi:hypothetical protein
MQCVGLFLQLPPRSPFSRRVVPNRAEAMTVTTPAGLQTVVDGDTLLEDVALVCGRAWRRGPRAVGLRLAAGMLANRAILRWLWLLWIWRPVLRPSVAALLVVS